MVAPKLAAPTFISGPRDDLATADVYSQTQSDLVINSIQKLTSFTGSGGSNVLRGGAALLAQLPIIKGLTASGGLAISKENLIARLIAGSGSLVSSIRNMSGDLATSVGRNLPESSTVVTSVGGIAARVDSAQIGNLRSLGDTINQVTQNDNAFSITDRGAQVGLYSGIIQEATKYGIPNSFGSLMAGVQDQYVVQKVATAVLPTLIGRSDLASLKAISTVLPPGAVQMSYPSTVRDFSRQYQAPEGTTQLESNATYAELMDAYDDIDPDWNTCTRELEDGTSEDVVSIVNLQNSSADMHRMIVVGAQTATTTDEKLNVLATVIPATSVDEGLQQHFPASVTGPAQRQQKKTSDPRLFADDMSWWNDQPTNTDMGRGPVDNMW